MWLVISQSGTSMHWSVHAACTWKPKGKLGKSAMPLNPVCLSVYSRHRGTTDSTILKFAPPYVVPLISVLTSTDNTFGANFSTRCSMCCLLLINISGIISTQSCVLIVEKITVWCSMFSLYWTERSTEVTWGSRARTSQWQTGISWYTHTPTPQQPIRGARTLTATERATPRTRARLSGISRKYVP